MNRRNFIGLSAAALALGACSTLDSTGKAQAANLPANKLVLGDSYTQGVGADGEYGWAERVRDARVWAAKIDGKGGSGYANPTGYGAGTYVDRLWNYVVNPDIRLVVIQGSSNDVKYSGADAATGLNQAFKLLPRKFPNARVIVMGICNPYGAGQDLIDTNARVKRYADIFGYEFLNPIFWFAKGDGKLYANQANGHPNNAGHQLIADMFMRAYPSL